MKKAIIGKKIGMTQIFDENGKVVPVTVVEAGPCVVVQKKTLENDGYEAIQVGFEEIREKLANKPRKGQFAKAGVSIRRTVKEFRLEDITSYEVGQEIKADVFEAGDKVDVSAVSKGKGSVNTTVLNLQVVKVIAEKNLILIKGGIPGPNKGTVVIKNTVRA